MKYTGKNTREISFPLGGIGTGCIGIAGNGDLVDWEIFNRPAKGTINGYSHFAIKAIKDGKPVTYILNGDIQKDFMGQYQRKFYSGMGFGPSNSKMLGFPHFRNVEFNGEFPVAELTFTDEKFPAGVKLRAFNPFIPGDSANSSIPAAFFEIEVNNTTNEEIKYQLAFTVSNPFESSVNKSHKTNACTMITMKNAGAPETDKAYGDLTVATDCDTVYTQTYWYRGGWMDAVVSFWNEFNSVENLKERTYGQSGDVEEKIGALDKSGKNDVCTIVAEVVAKAGESKKVRFVLSWNVPNAYNYWRPYQDEDGNDVLWKNYYATVFSNSVHSAEYAVSNWDSLYGRTMRFKNLLHNTSLPTEIIDAASANLSVLKSPTVLRNQDGSFYGHEGCHETEGSCHGTCQHVWNYAYAMCFLFPDLERSIRDLEFEYSTNEDGRMQFRIAMPLGREMQQNRACLDGQMGSVIKCYREWKISGNTEWLKKQWENIKLVLEYAWNSANEDKWDFDKDGVLEGRQHHTLDMELFGPSSWLQSMYLAALKAAAEMAEFLGDAEKASEYREVFEKGYKWTKENLFNGRYFVHKVDINDKAVVDRFDAADRYWNEEQKQIKYQICDGSSIDQVLGQWHADLVGLGDVLDPEQVKTAISSMMELNYRPSMREFTNPWRLFSMYDEAGSVICVYPDDVEKPKIPIPYCEETMTGFEYSFAGILCSRDMIDEGVMVTKAVRDRFNGERRNPWNEFECGSNYARSMASYAMIPILSGFEYHMPKKYIGFSPKLNQNNFNTIWSVESGWGSFSVKDNKAYFSLEEGTVTLSSFGLKFAEDIKTVKIDGKAIDFKFKDGIIYFDEAVINQGMEVLM